MASVRHKRKRKRGPGRLGLLLKLLCAAAVVAAATVGATVFFQVETISVTGNSRYSQEEIIAASEVQIGDNLFRMNKNSIAQRIRQKLPYIGEVNIQRGLPSTITFRVEEWGAVARVEVYAEPEEDAAADSAQADSSQEAESPAAETPWLISVGAKLLEEAGENSTAMSVIGLTILAPKAGDMAAVPQSQQSRLDALKELLTALDSMGQTDQVSAVDLTHSTWIGLTYRGSFQAKLPLGKELAHSLAVLSAAVDDTVQSRGEQAAGTMDLTQEEYDAVFTPSAG